MANHPPEARTRRQFLAAAGAVVAGGPSLLSASLAQEPAPEPPSPTAGMVLIPGGKAVIGTSEEDLPALAREHGLHPSWLANECPRRVIELRPYWLDRFPVTRAQFVSFCRATDYAWPYLDGVAASLPQTERRPVVLVNLVDARAYAAWAGKRLPSEAEWEFAARGPEGLVYPWGNTWDPARLNSNDARQPGGRGATRVDQYPSGASVFGIMDLCGNACEWTSSPYTDAAGATVVKSGFWMQHDRHRFRASSRAMSQTGGNRNAYIGFRCARRAE